MERTISNWAQDMINAYYATDSDELKEHIILELNKVYVLTRDFINNDYIVPVE